MIGYYPINPGAVREEDAFGAQFFRTHFFDRMRQVCMIDDVTPVLELLLTSGQVLDLSHIIELKPDYMLVSAFVDTRDCSNTYNAYIRYQTIYRINVLSTPRTDRPIGFTPHELSGEALEAPPARVKDKAGEPADVKAKKKK
jgi:hypothetical protein